MKGAVLEQSKLKKSGFYKKRILEIQENFKLFTVIIGVISIIMLILNIVNACTGSIGLGWIIFLNIVWVICAAGFVTYILLSAKRKQEYFHKIDEITYGDFEGDYTQCEAEENIEPIIKGNSIRLYETEKCYCLVTNGVREKLNSSARSVKSSGGSVIERLPSMGRKYKLICGCLMILKPQKN